MTVNMILICILVSVVIIGVSIFIFSVCGFGSKRKVVTIIVDILLIIILWCAGYWYCSNTAAGQRAMKTQRSEFGDGIERELTVYDMQGEVIEHYKGKFDIDTSSEGSSARILFDDEEGNRHIIYPGSGIVIINEIQN